MWLIKLFLITFVLAYWTGIILMLLVILSVIFKSVDDFLTKILRKIGY
jgi:hypothetical protein